MAVQSTSLLFWSVLFCEVFFSIALEYSNRWTVQIDGDSHEADRLARKHGFVNQGKIINNYYSFEHQMAERISNIPATHLHKGLLSEPNVKMVEQQELKSYELLSSHPAMEFHANDPRLREMWYISRNDGQPTHNVLDVWKRNITGAGVVVAVVDEGFNPEHPEIQANYDSVASLDVVDNDTYPMPSNPSQFQTGHGEKCAGIIGAILNNSYCGVGMAYNARLGGIRLFYRLRASDAEEAKALSHARDHVDIYSSSWGPDDRGFTVAGPGYFTKLALRDGVEKGRNGRGSIYVFSGGNGGIFKDSCAFNGYVNSIYTIAITGLESDGSLPVFSEPCAGIMAVTYTRDTFGDTAKVVTADTNNACTDRFGASSASAAMASGLIALMLSANQNLTWRDVQHIIVRTARPSPVKISNWNTNKAGLRVNDRVGFGLMDAKKMVDLAVNWTTVPPKVTCRVPRYGVNRRIPSKGAIEETINLATRNEFCDGEIEFLEHVEVAVDLNYTRRGDLLIKLISPQGTLSNLTYYRMYDSAFGTKDLNWVLMTLHHWGESAMGTWKLTLENSQLRNVNTGTLFNWTLILHGTKENPLDHNHYMITTARPQPTEKPTKLSTFSAVFTNLGASGRNGPTTLGSHYTGQDHDGQVSLSSGNQQWTVPYSGDYRIEAVGAAGGYDKTSNSAQYRGRGARMIGTFSLYKGEIIQILVGQEGGINIISYGSGGGGGTFVVTGSNTPLIIAGGGGGVNSVSSRHAGCDASARKTGKSGYKSWSGGSNGHGAQTTNNGLSGGGGGGFYSSGRSGSNFNGAKGWGGEGGEGFLQGGVGGRAMLNNVDGGFGGGGGATGLVGGGGGGGGYSGGSSGRRKLGSCGGGGGSYNTGTDQHNHCCFNTAGHGRVTITLL